MTGQRGPARGRFGGDHTLRLDCPAAEHGQQEPDQTAAERTLRGAIATDMSRGFVTAARDLLPAGATFAVETGDKVVVSTPVSLYAARGYSQFQLLPRRLVPPESAQWLLCYGCDQAAYASRFEVVWDAEPGLAIMRART